MGIPLYFKRYPLLAFRIFLLLVLVTGIPSFVFPFLLFVLLIFRFIIFLPANGLRVYLIPSPYPKNSVCMISIYRIENHYLRIMSVFFVILFYMRLPQPGIQILSNLALINRIISISNFSRSVKSIHIQIS